MRLIVVTFSAVLLLTTVAAAQAPGWIGVTIHEGADAGVEVSEVEPGSPAEDAGLQPGDQIVEFDGMRVVGVRQFSRVIAETPVGRTVSVRVIRDGRERTLQVTPVSRPRSGFGIPSQLPSVSDLADRIRASIAGIHVAQEIAALGLQVDHMTPQLREFFGAEADSGVLVTSVEADSPASEAGLRAGDVIIEVGEKPVDSPGDVRDGIDWNQDALTLRILRDRREQEIRIRLPAER